MKRYNFSNKGNTLIGIVVALIVVGLISGGLYYYFSKQIPEVSEKPAKEEITKPKEEITKPEEKITPTPEITCQNKCLPVDSKRCSNDDYQTCGNYDTDDCLEWGPITNCPPNTVCRNGNCIQQYLFDKCLGISCDGFCYSEDRAGCIDGKVIYKDGNDYEVRSEVVYGSYELPGGLEFSLSYPKSVIPDEVFEIEITANSNNPVSITIPEIKFIEWKSSSFIFRYGDIRIENAYMYKITESNKIELSGDNSPKTIKYTLKAPPYPSPYGGRITIYFKTVGVHLGWMISNPITIYPSQNYSQCGNKLFDPKVGVCFDGLLFPSMYNKTCNINNDCSNEYVCVYHQCISSKGGWFIANKPHKIAIVPLYLVKDIDLAKDLQVTEQEYVENIAKEADQFWLNEKNKWNPSSDFSISHKIINCSLYYDEYFSLVEKSSDKTYNEIINRCGLDKNVYDMVAFVHVRDSFLETPFYMSVSIGDIILIGSVRYDSSEPERKLLWEDRVKVLIHETIHSFGPADIHGPSLNYHQYGCYLNILNMNTDKGLCPAEAYKIGLIQF